MNMNLFKFDPEASDAPLRKGRYPAEIVAAEPRTSKAGNEMLEVTHRVHTKSGQEVFLKDYLVATPRAKWKIRAFCDALDLDYAKGEIDPVGLLGRNVVVEVDVVENDGEPDRNTIVAYASGEAFEFAGAGDDEEKIPF